MYFQKDMSRGQGGALVSSKAACQKASHLELMITLRSHLLVSTSLSQLVGSESWITYRVWEFYENDSIVLSKRETDFENKLDRER